MESKATRLRKTLILISAGTNVQLTTEEADQLLEVLDGLAWVAQTHHQGHHDGALEECRKATCDYAMRLLGRKPLVDEDATCLRG